MCGLAGIIDPSTHVDEREHLMKEMLSLIAHRGPDGESIYSQGYVTLGHRRLAIIDLETGNQPIFNEDQTVGVVYNGEIYNYRELRNELEQKGHKFRTQTDTEILVHLYEEEGTGFFERLNGLFAFALLDIPKNRVVLVRDHFGIKPMHYVQNEDFFGFASEQKSLLHHPKVERSLNLASLHSHVNLRYTQRDETLFAGIKRLPPAHYLVVENGQSSLHRYWSLDPAKMGSSTLSEEETKMQMNHLIKQAVERQLVSDVPIGVYLSGGMDSSTIVQKMHELGVGEINTFTMGFNEPTDEFSDASVVAKHFGTNHRTHSLDLKPLADFPEVIWHAEEPKINLLQGFNMSKFVREHVPVVLGGLGGDELFAGYDIHKFIHGLSFAHQAMPGWLKGVASAKSSLAYNLQTATGQLQWDEYRRGVQMLLATGDVQRAYSILRNVWEDDDAMLDMVYTPDVANQIRESNQSVKEQFAPYFGESAASKPLDQVLYTELHTKMVNDYLLTEDRVSMSHSVEERVPFLDKDLVEFAFTIPADMKIQKGQSKYLFREAMKGYLPDQILRKKKWGFTVNPYLQFKKDLKQTAEAILTETFVKDQGIFNYGYIRRILDAKPHPRMRWHYNYLWVVMGLAIWQRMFLDSTHIAKHSVPIEGYYS